MLTKRKYNSHAVAEALIQHFGEMLRCAGEVLETVKGEHHAKKKIVSNIDVGRNYCYGHGFVGMRRGNVRRHETFRFGKGREELV